MDQSGGAAANYADADVRYFSLSQGDEHSYTLATMMDAEIKIDSDGFANFIIADDTPETRAAADKLGVNFMRWKTNNKMILIYRHMLPNSEFENGINKVSSYDRALPVEEQIAAKTIGKFALSGKLLQQKSIAKLSEFPKF